jgi:Holliday junction resolvasome RuvABC endonuclease subunit
LIYGKIYKVNLKLIARKKKGGNMERMTKKPETHHFMDHIRILTNDPSFTAWGWAVIDMKGEVIKVGCIKTEPESAKRRIRKGDDTVRRIGEINDVLLSVIGEYNIQILLCELPHGSQNAQAAVMIGAVTGITQTLADCKGLPIDWYSEQDAKKHLLHKKSAVKKEIIDAISQIYKVPWKGVKYHDEAVADAMAIYHVAKSQSPLLKMNLR